MDLYQCDHPETDLRRRVQANGVVIYGRQCLRCGHWGGAISKSSAEVVRRDHFDDYDQGLRDRWYESRRAIQADRAAAYLADVERGRLAADAVWRARYEAHMASPEWADLRARVLLRADGTCEGCGQRRPTQVHHLTYDHLGDEFLWELVALCRHCHRRVHGITAPEGLVGMASR